jgi:hypothetical protein
MHRVKRCERQLNGAGSNLVRVLMMKTVGWMKL